MRCMVLEINRNNCKLYKGNYTAVTGTYQKGLLKKQGFYIPDNVKPLNMQTRKTLVPLFIVNEQTATAFSTENIQLVEKPDIDIHTKLNLLSKAEFWKSMSEKAKLGIVEMLIYLAAGYGFLRFLEYLVFTLWG